MLVLSRKEGEELIAFDDIVIHLLSIGECGARVAIQAKQKKIIVHPREIYEELRERRRLPKGIIIKVVIVDIRGDKVRFGIKALKEIPVHRREVFESIAKENAHGQQPPPAPQIDWDAQAGVFDRDIDGVLVILIPAKEAPAPAEPAAE